MMEHPKDPIAGGVKKWLFEVKRTERLWHIPLLASLCSGLPILAGLYFGNLPYGLLASTAGLVILYLPSTSLMHRMVTMMACSFGFMITFTIGVAASAHPLLSAGVLGGLAFCVQWVANYGRMRPPGPFFFLMIASIATSMPFELRSIPARVGVVGMGAMLACVLALIYSAYIVRRYPPKPQSVHLPPSRYGNFIESAITALFMGGSLLAAHLLQLDNPYWVPISCLAVMQGVTLHHIWQRSLHRILGTMAGLGLTWLLLSGAPSVLTICLTVFVLQFVVEMLVVRHYGLAVLFITPLTILLAEAGSALRADPNVLIPARMLDIALGSIIGAIAGWFLHHEQLRHQAERRIRKSRVALWRKGKKP